jgi:hypothetical protein
MLHAIKEREEGIHRITSAGFYLFYGNQEEDLIKSGQMRGKQ